MTSELWRERDEIVWMVAYRSALSSGKFDVNKCQVFANDVLEQWRDMSSFLRHQSEQCDEKT